MTAIEAGIFQTSLQYFLDHTICGGKKSEGCSWSFVESCCFVVRRETIQGASCTLRCLCPAALEHGLCCTMASASWIWKCTDFPLHSQNQGKEKPKVLMCAKTCNNEFMFLKKVTVSKLCNKVYGS